MRREDKRKMMPKFTFTVPAGFHLECWLDEYRLYADTPSAYGIMHRLIRTYWGSLTEEEVQRDVGRYLGDV